MIRRLGTFVQFSVFSQPTTVDWTIIGDTKELNIHGSHLGPYCYPLAIDMLLKGRVPAEEIVTHPARAARAGLPDGARGHKLDQGDVAALECLAQRRCTP